VPIGEARAFGVMKINTDGRVTGFAEKPPNPQPLPGQSDLAPASMGIYVSNAAFLYEQLIDDADDRTSTHDFGTDIIPRLIRRGSRVFSHRFAHSCVNMTEGRPYWRDVGTVDAYWEANTDLVSVTPHLNLYDQEWPIWTYQEQLPPAKFVFDDDGRRGTAIDSLVSGGCIISGSLVRRSLLFSNVRIHSYCMVEDAVILPNVDVGRGVVVKRAVIDKYCHLPPGLEVGVDPDADRKRFYVTERGIALVTPEMLGQQVHHLR